MVEIPADAMEYNPNSNFPPPPPPPPAPEELFKVVEQMPRFPGCDGQGLDDKALTACSKEKLSRYIFSRLKYPSEAREAGTQGKAIVQFVVKKDGTIGDIKLLRDPGNGCGESAKQVIDSMSDDVTWIPGKQRGRPVNVLYTLPIDFKL